MPQQSLFGAPGRSSRTPVKHFLLDAIVGKVAGTLSLGSHRVPARANPFLCVDLCGGDGEESDSHKASPKILFKHADWLRERGKAADLVVIEKNENTFEKLESNLTNECLHGFVTLSCSDSRTYRLPRLKVDQAVFVHCDPNNVDQTPLTEPFVSSFNDFTTYLVTLGCNVSGIKRTAPEKRSVWFDYARLLTDRLPRHHDAILFWLNRDDAMWAYLLSLPAVWSHSFQVMACQKTSKHWEKGVSAASYRTERVKFEDQLSKLFLTKAEYANRK